MSNKSQDDEEDAVSLGAAERPDRASEAEEITEAGLKDLADQTAAEIGAEGKRILDAAAAEMEPSPALGIGQEKAEAVFASGGFAERIDAAKKKIAALRAVAMAKATALLSGESETVGTMAAASAEAPSVAENIVPAESPKAGKEKPTAEAPKDAEPHEVKPEKSQFDKEANRLSEELWPTAPDKADEHSAAVATPAESIEGKKGIQPPMTFDQYVASRSHEGIASRIRDGARLAELKMKKVENPGRVLGMIHYLEDHARASQSFYANVKEKELEQATARLKKEGYDWIMAGTKDEKSQKIQISAHREVPYRFNKRDADRVAKVANSSRDPVEIFERLRDLGYKLNGYDVTFCTDEVNRFIESPHVGPFLQKLEALKGVVEAQQLIGGSFFGNSDHQSVRFMDLAEREAKEGLLNETAIKNLKEISSVLGMPLGGDGLEAWADIAQDPATAELLKIVVGHDRRSVSRYNLGGLAANIKALKEEGVEDELVMLLKEGFDYDSFGIYRLTESTHRSEDWQEVISVMKEFKADPQFHKFALDLASASGLELSARADTMARFRDLYSHPEILTVLDALRAIGVDTVSFVRYSEGDVKTMLADLEVMAAFAEPGFKEFVAMLHETGYAPNINDILLRKTRGTDDLLDAYRNPEFRTALAAPDGVAVAKKFKFFTENLGYCNLFTQIMRTEKPLETVEKLEKSFDYKPDALPSDASSLCELLENREIVGRLFDPKIVTLAQTLKNEFNISFTVQSAGKLVETADSPTMQSRLADQGFISFVKTVGDDPDIYALNALAEVRRDLRGIAVTLAQQFGYRIRSGRYDEPMLRKLQYENHQLVVDLTDPAKLEATKKVFEEWGRGFDPGKISQALQVRDNPEFAETADRLITLADMNLKSLSSLEQIHQITLHNLVPVFEKVKDSPKTKEFLLKNLDRISTIPQEKIPVYVEIFHKIEESPSQEVQRLKDQLLSQLLKSNRPLEDYEEVEAIFIKNNIPTVGKVFDVFATLYDHERLGKLIEVHKNLVSPVLEHASARRRDYLIYQDLVDVHIASGNRSLKEYVEVLQSSSDVLDRYERGGIESLVPREQEQLRYFVGKLETLLARSALDTADDAFRAADLADLSERVKHVREGLKVAEGQTVLERVSEMYLRPAGVKSLDEILEKMHSAKAMADGRSRTMIREAVQRSHDGVAALELSAGDFLKGTDPRYIANILQNGSVAKEFLGANSDSDSTPLDTDVSLVLPEDVAGGVTDAIDKSIAKSFGGLLFVVKDHGQFQRTEHGSGATPEAGKRELFKTGLAGERHYGIRTGFGATEIDFMIAQENLVANQQDLEKVYFEIAQNGFYIPVADKMGHVIFTPEMYDERRKAFAGLKKFDGEALAVRPTTPDEHSYAKVAEIAATLPEDSERVDAASQQIRNEVEKALGNLGVALRPEFDTSILGAEFLDTGSTGRHTNTPGDFDFDFSLKLDARDFPRARQLAEAIKGTMKMEKDDSHEEQGGYYQLRAKGVTEIAGQTLEKPLDIDIGFAKKSDLSVYGSHDAIRDKLNFVRQRDGDEAYRGVVANVVLAKEILKEGHAYKKLEDGGLGGIGVENWILANGGNMEEAFRSFRDAAYENGARLPFEEFQKRYRILDAGVNVKYLGHDNFVEVLKPGGYEAMLNAIDGYLADRKP